MITSLIKEYDMYYHCQICIYYTDSNQYAIHPYKCRNKSRRACTWYVLRRLGAFGSTDYKYKLDVYNDLEMFINLKI